MKPARSFWLLALLALPVTVLVAGAGRMGNRHAQQPPVRIVDLKTPDGTLLKASYFAAAKPGPGVLLLHQINRDRKSWDNLAEQLAAAGIHTLTLDLRGHGESGGTPFEKRTPAEVDEDWRRRPGDVDLALQYLTAQPGVDREVIGIGGAGSFGVLTGVATAQRHPGQVKSLVLISGETPRDGLQFLHQASQLPGLFVVDDEDEYPPTAEAMALLYVTASSPGKKFVHYSAAKDAPWLWYEPFDVGRVPANGHHGTDLFTTHQELPGIIVEWLVTTLITTPGHAPADPLAAGSILNQLQTPSGIAPATTQLKDARKKDPAVQLFPEISASIVGQDYLREKDSKSAIGVFQLILLAYPTSADAHENLAEAYLANGRKDLARQYADTALALLNSHAAPASSWSDTDQQRGEIRRSAENVLTQVSSTH